MDDLNIYYFLLLDVILITIQSSKVCFYSHFLLLRLFVCLLFPICQLFRCPPKHYKTATTQVGNHPLGQCLINLWSGLLTAADGKRNGLALRTSIKKGILHNRQSDSHGFKWIHVFVHTRCLLVYFLPDKKTQTYGEELRNKRMP